MSPPRLVCLVTVGDGANGLPGFLEAISPLADAVVALDDSGSDATGRRLRAHPLVKSVVTSPPPEAVNGGTGPVAGRNRMLAAAAALQPDWVLLLNGDEGFAPSEALRLRAFIENEATRGFAYGFRLVGSDGAGMEAESRGPIAYRLFSYRAGQRFSPSAPSTTVPTDIPRGRWIDTTLCIRRGTDRGAAMPTTPVPDRRAVVDWTRHRRMRNHVLQDPLTFRNLDPARPTLSAIVIAQNDRDRIVSVMDALTRQCADEPTEIILVDSGGDGTSAVIRKRYPEVRVIHLHQPALPGRARNAGLRAARGDFVVFPGSHVVVGPDFLQRRIEAHARGYALVSGHIRSGTETLTGWASYFLDHCTALPGRPAGELASPPVNCSYPREPLVMIGGFPEDRRAGEDTVVNRTLFDLGYKAYHTANHYFYHFTRCSNPVRLWRHHVKRGLAYGQILWEQSGGGYRLASRWPDIRWLLLRYPLRRLLFIGRQVSQWGRPVKSRFILSMPLVIVGILGAACGALSFLLRPGDGTSHGETAPTVKPLLTRKESQ
jgi:glycosyltransferase involved in cell wall biosynthesis